MKLFEYLRNNANQCPDKIIAVCDDEKISYSQLYEKASLLSKKYTSREVVVFKSSQTIDFLITYFAIHIANAIAVPLECDIPERGLNKILESLKKTSIPDDVADILYTTGTTGKSKGVMISHKAIVATAMNLIEGQSFSRDLCFIISGPFNHIGSLSKVFPTIIQGGTLIIISGLKDFDAFFKALEYPCDKMATFMVPSGLRMLIRFGAKRLKEFVDKIEFIETGAAPMAQTDMEDLRKLLPKTRLYNTYASTETGVVSTYDYSSNDCVAGCLGKSLCNSNIIITEEGNVACSGNTLMSGYAGEEELTESVMRNGILYTSDKGYIDDKGMLRLLGRDGDVINVGGYKVSPVEIENIVLSMNEIDDCICIPFYHSILGTIVKLLYVKAKDASITKTEIAKYIASMVERYKVPQSFEEVGAIKRTYNGKLDRKAYLK